MSIVSIGKSIFPVPGQGLSELPMHRAVMRQIADEIQHLRKWRVIAFRVGVITLFPIAVLLGMTIWSDTFDRTGGEPFSLTSGTSVWPAEILRLVVFAAGFWLSFDLYHHMRETFFDLTAKYRLLPESDEDRDHPSSGSVLKLWKDYRKKGTLSARLKRVCLPFLFYIVLCCALVRLLDMDFYSPVRGDRAWYWDRFLMTGAMLGFLLLALLTFDSARLCRQFISELNQRVREYPSATRQHFSAKRGGVGHEYLTDWINLQLIADLTERVGKVAYLPSILLLLLVLARNSWWAAWCWPVPLIIIFGLNFGLALSSVLVLQKAARRAKKDAEESLTAQVKRLKADITPDPKKNNALQVEELLQEVRALDRGAFVPFWENPVVGALFLSSGGTTMLQLIIWLMGS